MLLGLPPVELEQQRTCIRLAGVEHLELVAAVPAGEPERALVPAAGGGDVGHLEHRHHLHGVNVLRQDRDAISGKAPDAFVHGPSGHLGD